MNNFKNLNEMEKNRINELRFRALIFKMLSITNNNFCIITKYLESINKIIKFDFNEIKKLASTIIEDRYKPSTDEIIKINLILGHSIKEIADILDMNINTIKTHIYRNENYINTMILYPRLNEKQLNVLRDFLKHYYSFYVPVTQVFKS